MKLHTNKLFVYGIFLDEDRRKEYGMFNPQYNTVKDYCTYGDSIVEAIHAPGRGLALSGVVVNVLGKNGNHKKVWRRLDALEGAYNRELITLVDGTEAYMYVGKGSE